MYLYYQDLRADCEPEFIGKYDTIEEMMLKVKQECDNGHEECPNDIPSYNEYLSGDFSNYPDYYEYSFHMPTYEEINNLQEDDFITIIKDFVDDEYMYLVSNVKYNSEE